MNQLGLDACVHVCVCLIHAKNIAEFAKIDTLSLGNVKIKGISATLI